MEVALPGLERRLRAQLRGEVAFDPYTRGRYATDASHYQIMPLGVVMPRSVQEAGAGDRARARRGRERHRARRRHLAVRADDQFLAHRRLFEISRSCRRARRPRQALRGRAGHRARRAQPPAQAARPVVSGRHLDLLARHHRRHGRQQFLRCALAALRQHPRERALGRCPAGRWQHGAFRAGRARPVRPAGRIRRCGRSPATSWRSARATPI